MKNWNNFYLTCSSVILLNSLYSFKYSTSFINIACVFSTAQTNGTNTHANDSHTTQPQLPSKNDACSWLKYALSWFCGIDGQQNTSSSMQSYMIRLRDLTSLRQSTRERLALYTALTVLFVLDLFLYLFFSTGSDFGLLRNSVFDLNPVTFGNESFTDHPVNTSFSRWFVLVASF